MSFPPHTVNPNEPLDVQVAFLTHIEARIEWTVPFIVFSAETYTLVYSTTQDDLNSVMGDAKFSGTDLTLTDQLYSTLLKDLIPGTTYYYQIKIENTFGMTLTQIYTFATRTSNQIHVYCYTNSSTIYCKLIYLPDTYFTLNSCMSVTSSQVYTYCIYTYLTDNLSLWFLLLLFILRHVFLLCSDCGTTTELHDWGHWIRNPLFQLGATS